VSKLAKTSLGNYSREEEKAMYKKMYCGLMSG
jgi:hypothetical protein